MEDLSRRWGNSSLTEKEKAGYVLPKTQRKCEFMIVAKFLTPRALIMDAVGRTFKQVWRCSDGFKIRNMSEPYLCLMMNAMSLEFWQPTMEFRQAFGSSKEV